MAVVALIWFFCKRRSRRNKWTKDLESAKANFETSSTSSATSGDSNNTGGMGRKLAAFMPFGLHSTDSVDATPHAKHGTQNDAFAGISRFRPDGTLKVNTTPARPGQNLISSGVAAPAHMGTIMERQTSTTSAPDSANLHDTANLMDHVVQHSPGLLSPTSAAVFSFGNTPMSRYQQPTGTVEAAFKPGSLSNSRPSQGQLSSNGSTGLMRGGSGDGLLAVQASGDYSDRFHEAPIVEATRRGSGRQGSGTIDAGFWSVLYKDLEIQKQIGEGSFGKVFLAKWRETTVAVKQLIYTGVSGSLEDNDEFIQQGMNVLLQGLEQVTKAVLMLMTLCNLRFAYCVI